MVRATIDLGCKKSPTAGGCWGNYCGLEGDGIRDRQGAQRDQGPDILDYNTNNRRKSCHC